MKRSMRSSFLVVAPATVAIAPAVGLAQQAVTVELPDPALFFQNTSLAVDGDVGYVPSFDNDRLWSFSLVTGELLDADGMALAGNASDVFVFSEGRVGIPGWFPGQGVLVVDVSDATNPSPLGTIDLDAFSNVQGQNIEVASDGVIGFVASFPNDTLFSFNVETLSLQDPDGLGLPGNPDRIAIAGDRLAMVDTTNGTIMVADVSDPSNLTLLGSITLPGSPSFNSNDNIVFAADGRTGFVSSNQRRLYSFDVVTMAVLDPDGLGFGTTSFSGDIAIHGDTLACVWSRGLTFIDAGDPTNLSVISNAAFGEVVAPQGSATTAFTADGTGAAMPVIYPANLVYTFDVASGEQISAPFAVGDQPNFLTMLSPGDRVGVLCSGLDADNIFLISDLFDTCADLDGNGGVDIVDLLALLGAWGPNPGHQADLDGDGTVGIADFLELLASWGPCP
ncbi:MAG: hypothetical protein V3S08_10700 [Phycisphaerales bacterium]